MTTLDANLAAILKACDLGNDAVWAHKQSGKYIMYHWACEKAAVMKGVKWEPPVVVHADPAAKLAVILVTGRLGDQVEWSFGEAAPYNTTQTYPFAMAEKRAKDRVVLKLIGLHGLAYSEEEADDFKGGNGAPANGNKPTPTPPPKDARTEKIEELRAYAQQVKEALELAPDLHTVATIWREEGPALAELKTKSEKAHAHLVAVAQKRGFKEAA
jgi:hypothetical protein